MARYHASEENYFENEFSKTHGKKAVLDMSINLFVSYLEPLTQLPSGESGIISKRSHGYVYIR